MKNLRIPLLSSTVLALIIFSSFQFAIVQEINRKLKILEGTPVSNTELAKEEISYDAEPTVKDGKDAGYTLIRYEGSGYPRKIVPLMEADATGQVGAWLASISSAEIVETIGTIGSLEYFWANGDIYAFDSANKTLKQIDTNVGQGRHEFETGGVVYSTYQNVLRAAWPNFDTDYESRSITLKNYTDGTTTIAYPLPPEYTFFENRGTFYGTGPGISPTGNIRFDSWFLLADVYRAEDMPLSDSYGTGTIHTFYRHPVFTISDMQGL
jgi:hypothetical protein